MLIVDSVGNDGPWSAFNVRIGSPPQLLKMVASTSSPETWVVNTAGCTSHDPKDCITDRGQMFNAETSRTWEDWANATNYALDSDRDLPLHGTGIYGTDTLNFQGRPHGMDPDGVSIPHHIVAQISTKEYFLGQSLFIIDTRLF
jgi:Eukaryotic aspartyl protease